MRVYIAGQRHFGWAVYNLVKEMGLEIAGVSAPAWRTHGEEGKLDRLRSVAELDRVPWLEAGKLRADTLPPNVDLLIAAHSHDFIGRATRNRLRLGAIGYHPSLLPLHRGRDAIRWTLRLGERVTGGTVFWLNDTVDGGPIAVQEHVFVPRGATAATLWREVLQPLGLRLLRRTLTDIQHGVLVRIPQDPALATWEPSLNPPPLFRPELPQLGNTLDGYTVIADVDELPLGM